MFRLPDPCEISLEKSALPWAQDHQLDIVVRPVNLPPGNPRLLELVIGIFDTTKQVIHMGDEEFKPVDLAKIALLCLKH